MVNDYSIWKLLSRHTHRPDRVPYLVEFQSARFLSTTTTITNKLQVRLNVREKWDRQMDGH